MHILNQQVLDICGEGAFPKPYEYKDHLKQCYNSHQYDHQKARRKNPLRCGFCAAEGHHKRDCHSTDTKCAACGGHYHTMIRMQSIQKGVGKDGKCSSR